jgi:superfamily II DNA helicase RecQ
VFIKYLLNYFDEPAANFCGSCDVCLSQEVKVDATIEAQKLLSAVTRLQERFGINYVIDFLRGSNTTKTEHQSIKTFGIGKDISKDQWKVYVKDMLQLGYLQQSDTEFPVLQLNEISRQILKGETTLKKLYITDTADTEKFDALHNKELDRAITLGCWRSGFRRRSASRSWSKTGRVPTAISPAIRSRSRRPTATA